MTRCVLLSGAERQAELSSCSRMKLLMIRLILRGLRLVLWASVFATWSLIRSPVRDFAA